MTWGKKKSDHLTGESLEASFASLDALCDQARETLVDLGRRAEVYKTSLAEQYGVDPDQIELLVTEGETQVKHIIRSK